MALRAIFRRLAACVAAAQHGLFFRRERRARLVDNRSSKLVFSVVFHIEDYSRGLSKVYSLDSPRLREAGLLALRRCVASQRQQTFPERHELQELAEKGIIVNCLALGSVQTEMFRNAFPGFTAPVSPEGMAEFIEWFAITGCRFFNGKVLPVALSNP